MSDRTVRAAIGAGARSVEQLTELCSAASDCLGCWPELERLIEEHASRSGARRGVAVSIG